MKAAQSVKSPTILVIDVGGTDVKLLATGQKEPRKIPSGPDMTASKMVRLVKKSVRDWKFDCVSMGYPGPVIHGHPLREPHNLGGGWVGFNFRRAFSHPIKIINDAAMQALGSYKGGRMLFLGFGTGLGAAMIASRLPSVLAMPITIICIFSYVKRRGGEYIALLCALSIFSTIVFQRYAAEVRPYSLLTACITFVMICYQRSHSKVWVIMFAISLAAAELVHYYAIFALVPFGFAETIVLFRSRKFRWTV